MPSDLQHLKTHARGKGHQPKPPKTFPFDSEILLKWFRCLKRQRPVGHLEPVASDCDVGVRTGCQATGCGRQM